MYLDERIKKLKIKILLGEVDWRGWGCHEVQYQGEQGREELDD